MCHPECRHTRVYHGALALLLHRNGAGASPTIKEMQVCLRLARELEAETERALTPAVPPKDGGPF